VIVSSTVKDVRGLDRSLDELRRYKKTDVYFDLA
jgi:hypothetical protein